MMNLILDTNILTRLCYTQREENRLVGNWLSDLLATRAHEVTVHVPEIADYEARRGLLHVALRSGRSTTRSLERLDQLGELLTFLPLQRTTLRLAARLWAESRHAGRPTAGEESVDGDVILAAQALEVSGVVVTENIRHLSRLVTSCRWHKVSAE
jgi:predicted nucleic acid-binding protein